MKSKLHNKMYTIIYFLKKVHMCINSHTKNQLIEKIKLQNNMYTMILFIEKKCLCVFYKFIKMVWKDTPNCLW